MPLGKSQATVAPSSGLNGATTAGITQPAARPFRVEVNFCKNLQCANYGAPFPMQKTPGIPETYRLIGGGTQIGTLHARCGLCGEKFPLKNNGGITEELRRLRAPLDAHRLRCPDAACPNHVRFVPDKAAFKSIGLSAAGSLRWRCKVCGRTFSRPSRSTGKQKKSDKNLMLFKMLVGHMPIRRIADAIGVSPSLVERRIKFIHAQCVAFAAAQELQFADIEIPRLWISTDAQEHTINWRDKEDRRNVVIVSTASVDNPTGYCFGMHMNYDPDANREEIETDARTCGDLNKPYVFRKYSRVWLEADYAAISARQAVKRRTRALAAASPAYRVGLPGAIDDLYDAQQEREDIEDGDAAEARRMLPDKGIQTRRDYLLYAHFTYLRSLCPRVGKWRFCLDQDPGIRAAVLAAFVEEVKAERCDAWFVRISKGMTIDRKRKARAAAKEAFKAEKLLHPGLSDRQVILEMIKKRMAAMTPHGNWNDRWLDHPRPNMGEPEKAVSWLTERVGFTPDHAAALYAKVSMHGVDSLFNRMRRRSAMLDRPITTASSGNRIWTAYAAYDPAQTARMTEIIRVCHNFIWVSGKDKKTPAMRIGIADALCDYEDILQFVP